jgi:hypothetical protein
MLHVSVVPAALHPELTGCPFATSVTDPEAEAIPVPAGKLIVIWLPELPDKDPVADVVNAIV